MRSADQINILLVDDHPAKLMSYEAVLADLDANLIKASSAREALQLLLKNEVAIVLVDVCMPELDGFQLAEMIRDHPRFRDTAIVFISAVQLDDRDRLRGYQLGGVDYVPVPIIPELLRAKVRVFADLYRKTRELERLNRGLEARVAERTAALENANARLRLALDLAQLGTWDWDLLTGRIEWSDRCFGLHGYEPNAVTPSIEAWTARLHPDDAAAAEQRFRGALDDGADHHDVYRCVRSDGSISWCQARGLIERDATGRAHRVLGVVMDITEHKSAEERQRLMVQELHHRVKNTLATVQAISGLTARTASDLSSFHRAFSARLESLSRTHTMLVDRNWHAIGIEELLSSELRSFQDAGDRRLVCNGPPYELPSSIALGLGLAIHELTTNAVKYGALSVPSGRVEVTWTVRSEAASRQLLELSWIEREGPPVEEPRHKGFGTTLLQKVFSSQYGARTELKYCPSGVEYFTAIELDA